MIIHLSQSRSEGATYIEQVKEGDLDIWQKLWVAKPEKKTEKGVETAGVGKGELSLYIIYTNIYIIYFF